MSRMRAIMRIEHVDEDEARKRIEEIMDEQRMSQRAVEAAMYNADTGDDL